ncbi:hypothetical protein AAKU55_000980 [Oxalobacteraceae bacterium GrIS 1.11]
MLALGTLKFTEMSEKFDQLTKLVHSQIKHSYVGDIEAESRFECLTFSSSANVANFVGLEYLTGRIGDRSGELILQHVGSIKFGKLESMLNVLSGSGTGELVGIRGHGHTKWTESGSQVSKVSLEYSFD